MVVNLEPLTVAVSHHFLSPAGLHSTLRLLRDAPHQVSGVRTQPGHSVSPRHTRHRAPNFQFLFISSACAPCLD